MFYEYVKSDCIYEFTSMNYPIYRFLSISNISESFMAIVRFVLLTVQVA